MKLEPSQPSEEWDSFSFGFRVYRETGDTEEIYSQQIKDCSKQMNQGFVKLGSPLRAFGYHFEEGAQIALIGHICIVDSSKAPEQVVKGIENLYND